MKMVITYVGPITITASVHTFTNWSKNTSEMAFPGDVRETESKKLGRKYMIGMSGYKLLPAFSLSRGR